MPAKNEEASKEAAEITEFTPAAAAPRPRLKTLVIRNLGCIGNDAVTIELDDIVVLVGPNNVGKSTILRAYELAMSEGSARAKLSLDDFPHRRVDSEGLPQIELHTVVFDNSPGERWIDRASGEGVVRERWTWSRDGVAPTRVGFDTMEGKWAEDGVPWGAANVANGKRPQPHRIDAFALPEAQAKQVTDLLLAALKDRIKETPIAIADDDGNPVKTPYGEMLDIFVELQKSIVQETEVKIRDAEAQLTGFISEIFRGYRVEFDARPEEDIANALNFFKAGAQLKMGPDAGFLSSIERQGSGARRALMWAALRFVTESSATGANTRPHVLLLDEPELCLHPNAIRDACQVLYDLPLSGNWQVMVTTHAPAFVDLSRDNTTIVRVERAPTNQVYGTTVFRPRSVRLSTNEKSELKLLNLCEPHFAEFFFGGETILVEGDTEYTAFNHVRRAFAPEFAHVHIVRARGKAILGLLSRIINQFGGTYAVLHDSDSPKTQRTRKGVIEVIANGAWTNNENIRAEVALAPGQVRLVAALQNFEMAIFGEESTSEKPYTAKVKLEKDAGAEERVRQLLGALVDFEQELPPGFYEWTSLDELDKHRIAFMATAG